MHMIVGMSYNHRISVSTWECMGMLKVATYCMVRLNQLHIHFMCIRPVVGWPHKVWVLHDVAGLQAQRHLHRCCGGYHPLSELWSPGQRGSVGVVASQG